MRARRADMPPEIMEAWEQAYKELQAFIEQTDSDREYILYKGALAGTFHLWQWGDQSPLLTGVLGYEIRKYVETVADNSDYIRFKRQSQDADWITRQIKRSWFRFDAAAASTAYRAVRISDIRTNERIDLLPLYGGVYVATDPRQIPDNLGILYVGESKSIRNRWKGHDKLNKILSCCRVFHLHCFNQQYFNVSRKHMENLFIYHLDPRFNIQKKRR